MTASRIDFIPTKNRLRHTRSGHSYTDPRNVEQSERIRAAYVGELHEGPVAVYIHTYGKLPKNTPKRVAREPHVCKPDVDNIAKAILDALNGVAFIDDRYVTHLSVTKHERERVSHECTLFEVKGA